MFEFLRDFGVNEFPKSLAEWHEALNTPEKRREVAIRSAISASAAEGITVDEGAPRSKLLERPVGGEAASTQA